MINILTLIPKPIYQSYWVVPNLLLADETPATQDITTTTQRITALLETGITHIIDLSNPTDQCQNYHYVHCWGGVDRTGTVIGCWLKRHFIKGVLHVDSKPMVLKDLWAHCPKSKYHQIPQSRGQKMLVAHWKLGE